MIFEKIYSTDIRQQFQNVAPIDNLYLTLKQKNLATAVLLEILISKRMNFFHTIQNFDL